MKTFQDLSLPSGLSKALQVMQFNEPTPIQAKAIPIALTGKDLIGCAQTGTGKTAAFCIPILLKLIENPKKNALVLAPTRELIQQIEIVWRNLTKYYPEMFSAAIIGGASMVPQIRALSRGPRIIFATPGRLMDHLNRRNVNLSKTAILVLDEADRMLDMGFAPQLTQILKYLPTDRQTLLFTATWEAQMDSLSKRYMKNPEKVSVGTVSQAATKINQTAIATSSPKKNELLLDELNARAGSVLIFARTKIRTDRVAKYLASYGMDVNRIHGGRTQGQRNSALAEFKAGKVRVLVATDIAARGLDVADIAHVINYDLPQVPEDYIHRIGRTGRAGATGNALSFITPEEKNQWFEITRLLKKTGSNVPNAMPQAKTSMPVNTYVPKSNVAARSHQKPAPQMPTGKVILPRASSSAGRVIAPVRQ
jgi:ATP-dependent RNA helicase DeaD